MEDQAVAEGWPSSGEEEESEEEEEEDYPLHVVDKYCQLIGVWERVRSRSRRTMTETCEVLLKDWSACSRPERLFEQCIARVIERALEGRPPPLYIGFALQPPGWERAFHVPLRAPEQNNAAAIAAYLLKMAANYDGLDLFNGSCQTKVSAVWALGQLGGRGGDMGLCVDR
jgi:hypothetical protein